MTRVLTGVAQKLWKHWRRYWCTHDWRPAQTSKGSARWCENCDAMELISAEEMYAYFGVYPKDGIR